MSILSQVETGVPIAQVARENGLHPTLVEGWKKEYLDNPEKFLRGPGYLHKDQARVTELERMVSKLYTENEFLKKTLKTMNERVEEEKRKSQYRRDTK